MHFKVAHAYEINLEDIKPEHMSMEYIQVILKNKTTCRSFSQILRTSLFIFFLNKANILKKVKQMRFTS